MKRAIIYARVSSKRQADDGLPVESQIDHCRTKAAALGATVVKVFTDGGISGTTDRRPSFQDALNFCAVADIDYFITWSSSRFARNHLDAGHYKAVLQRYNTRLIYSSTEVDIGTDDGWFIDAIGSVIDERYSRQVASDTRRSMLKAAKDGYFLGGRVPFGYVVVSDGKRKRLGQHPTEANTVRQIFTMALQGCGTKTIALHLNGTGLTLRGQSFSKNTLTYILKNEVYAGWTIFNRTNKRTPNPPEDWIKVKSHSALVSEEDFERVQKVLEKRKPANVGGQPRSNFAFTGLLKCGLCDASLQTCSGTGRSKVYHYYGCRNSLVGKHRCGFGKVRAELFDEWMLAELLDQVMTPERMADVVAQAYQTRETWAKDRSDRRKTIVAELRVAEKARSNLFSVLELHGQDAPNLGDITQRLREWNDRIRSLEASLVDLENERMSANEQPEVDPAEAAEVLRDIVLNCEDPKKLREFVGSFVREITVNDSEVVVDYHPECLVRHNHRAKIHSAEKWLPILGSLRTVRLTLVRPARFTVGKQDVVLTLAA